MHYLWWGLLHDISQGTCIGRYRPDVCCWNHVWASHNPWPMSTVPHLLTIPFRDQSHSVAGWMLRTRIWYKFLIHETTKILIRHYRYILADSADCHTFIYLFAETELRHQLLCSSCKDVVQAQQTFAINYWTLSKQMILASYCSWIENMSKYPPVAKNATKF